MSGKAAVYGNPEVTRRVANILVTNLTGGASPTTDPGIYRNLAAGFYVCVRPCALDSTGNFMTKRERECTPGTNIKPFFVAEYKVTILHVQVGMTDAATFDPHQHLGALQSW